MDVIFQQLRKPHGVLIPWLMWVVLLSGILWGVRTIGVEGAEQSLAKLELEWNRARQEFTHHKAAQSARKDLAQVWSVLPVERDFAPLALGITEEAKRHRVILPALSYKTEPTLVANTNKGVLQGTMTGRYEDLELAPADDQQSQTLTFDITIATYLRSEPDKPALQ
jgi:hypothetical protein